MHDRQERSTVSFSVFVWAIAVLITAIGWMFNSVAAQGSRVDKIEEIQRDFQNQISGQLGQIQADLDWLKRNIGK